MRVCVYQPGYFQPLHYYARAYSCDVFVLLCAAQVNRKVGQNKAKIKGKHFVYELKVPLSGGHRQPLSTTIPDYASGWVRRHIETIQHAYGKAKNFKATSAYVESMLRSARAHGLSLCSIGLSQASHILRSTGWQGQLIKLVRNEYGLEGSDWMLDIAESFGATTYVCGRVAYEEYLDRDAFAQAGIALEVQDWKCPEYTQFGDTFEPNLSVLDAMMHCTTAELTEILRGDGFDI